MSNKEVSIQIEEHNGLAVIVLDGSLDSSNLRLFKKELSTLVEEKKQDVLLDCEHLTYASSQVFGLFSCFNKIAKTQGAFFAFSGMTAQIVNILHILGLDVVFSMYDSREKAIQARRDQAEDRTAEV